MLDRINTDLGMDVTPQGWERVELAPGVSREPIQAETGVPLIRVRVRRTCRLPVVGAGPG